MSVLVVAETKIENIGRNLDGFAGFISAAIFRKIACWLLLLGFIFFSNEQNMTVEIANQVTHMLLLFGEIYIELPSVISEELMMFRK